MNREKRNFARLALHAKAYIHWDDQYIEGEVENVSIKGAFVTAASPFVTAASQMAINDVVAFTICDTPNNQGNCLFHHQAVSHTPTTSVRVTGQGMGLQFEKTLLVENGP